MKQLKKIGAIGGGVFTCIVLAFSGWVRLGKM